MSDSCSQAVYRNLYKTLQKDYKKPIVDVKKRAYDNFIIRTDNNTKNV